jgi:uracil DNA glycosylase
MSTTTKLTAEDYAFKLYEMLKPSGWHDVLKGFLLSEDFVNIIKTLEECVNDNKRFTPPLKNVFRAFMECPIDTLEVIVFGQD